MRLLNTLKISLPLSAALFLSACAGGTGLNMNTPKAKLSAWQGPSHLVYISSADQTLKKELTDKLEGHGLQSQNNPSEQSLILQLESRSMTIPNQSTAAKPYIVGVLQKRERMQSFAVTYTLRNNKNGNVIAQDDVIVAGGKISGMFPTLQNTTGDIPPAALPTVTNQLAKAIQQELRNIPWQARIISQNIVESTVVIDASELVVIPTGQRFKAEANNAIFEFIGYTLASGGKTRAVLSLVEGTMPRVGTKITAITQDEPQPTTT